VLTVSVVGNNVILLDRVVIERVDLVVREVVDLVVREVVVLDVLVGSDNLCKKNIKLPRALKK
jgi:hypothetical protein